MASNEGTSTSNAKLRKTLVTSETTEEKTENLIKGLNECANLNESFANNYNNSSLDIAVGEEEKHILNLLLEKGANVISENNDGKTALDVPKDLNTDDNGQIIQALDKKLQEKYKIIKFIRNVSKENDVVANILSLFKKNKGITSIKGELYEINLFSLILLRTLLSPNIDQFYLGTSVQEVGTLKDICLRYRENNKESLIFLYPVHTINEKITVKDLWNSTGNLSLSKYFNSYLNIRHKFVSRANDGMIQGTYEDTKCHFIIYTTAEEELSDKKILNQNSILDKTVQDILSTGDNYHNIFQYKYDDEDLKLLMKNVVVDRMKKLGEKLHESMQGNKYKNMLWDKHISSYHVFLANTIIAVSDIVIDDFRIGSFRKEFLSSTNESLAVFRKAFFKEAVRYTNISDENLVTIVEKVLLLPSAENVSELLQNVPTSYDLRNNRLYIIHNKIKTILLSSLYEMVISHTTYSEAFQIAIKEKLGCFYFKLPLAFGNIDINVNEFDVENSLNNISLTIENIIVKSEDKNILLYNKDKLDPSLLSNLLVFDKDSSMFKFNTCAEALGQNANKIINKLKNKIEDLDAYRFQFNIDNILKISFDADEYDYCLAKDFLNNLWFYTRQAKGHKIETYANYNLSWYYFRNLNPRGTFFPQQLCDIFSNIQNEIRKWWFLDTIQVHYVTNYMQIFNETLNDLANDFIISNPNKPYLNKTQEHNIAFNRQAIESLNLDTLTDLTVIETENTTLSATKLYQYFRETNYNYIFIDFNYICLLPLNDKFIKILEKIYRQRIIIIYEHLSIDNVNINDLLNPSLAKTIILVINENHLEKIMEKAPIKDYIK